MKLKFLSRIAKGIEGMSIAIKEMWVKCMPAAFLQSCSCVCPRMARAGHHIRRWDILLLQIVINGMSRQTSHHRLKSPLYRTMVQYGNRQIGGGGRLVLSHQTAPCKKPARLMHVQAANYLWMRLHAMHSQSSCALQSWMTGHECWGERAAPKAPHRPPWMLLWASHIASLEPISGKDSWLECLPSTANI